MTRFCQQLLASRGNPPLSVPVSLGAKVERLYTGGRYVSNKKIEISLENIRGARAVAGIGVPYQVAGDIPMPKGALKGITGAGAPFDCQLAVHAFHGVIIKRNLDQKGFCGEG